MRKSNYAYLFAGLSLLLVIGPALDNLLPRVASSAVSASCLLGTLLIGIWSLIESPFVFRVGVGLAGLAALFLIIEWVTGSAGLRLGTLLIVMAFLCLSVWHAARDVLFGGFVDMNRLLGGLCIYEMLGLIWAVMFACLVDVSPAAFANDILNASSSFWDFVYFSFVTLTTLGYGDMSPTGGITKALAYMEALIGQFYIAVLVASLVGSHLENRKH